MTCCSAGFTDQRRLPTSSIITTCLQTFIRPAHLLTDSVFPSFHPVSYPDTGLTDTNTLSFALETRKKRKKADRKRTEVLPADHIDRQMFSSTHGATNRLVKGGSARKAGNDQTVSHRSPYIHVVTTSLLRMSGVGIVRRTVSLQARLLSLDNTQDPWTFLIKVLQQLHVQPATRWRCWGLGVVHVVC